MLAGSNNNRPAVLTAHDMSRSLFVDIFFNSSDFTFTFFRFKLLFRIYWPMKVGDYATVMTKNIVMCFDGTDNNFGKNWPSNILELYKLLEKNSLDQSCFYQPGVGIDINLSQNSFQNPRIQNSIRNKLDSAFAFSIDYHVIQSYKYLIRTYKPGDKIYIFGFSRGSFVGRILAGMIEKIGLLDEGLEDMVKTAWKIYKEWEIMGQPNNLENPAKCGYSIKLFKQTFCRYDVSIEFMGLFDSINSCGIFFDKLFPFTSNSSNVKHIRHAVSIHERRSKFKQNLFIPHSYLPHFLASKSSCSSLNSRSSGQINDENYTLSNTDNDSDRRFHNIPVQYAKKCSSDLLEVWFPGDHSDIGGGWPCDDNGSRISNLPMQWILSSAFRFGVRFKKNALQEFNIKFTPLLACLSFQHDTLSLKGYNYSYNVNPYCSSINNQEINYEEENVDNPGSYYVNPISDTNSMELPKLKSPLFPIFPKHSSESEIFDEINQPNKNEALRGHGNSSIFASFMWWILEILPIGYMVENQNGKWRPLYWPNLGESRNIPSEAKIHWSILWRMKFIKDIDYKNLPSVYETLQKLVDQEQNSDIITNPDKQEIILGLKDVVDLENEIIKPDIDRIILKLKNSNKVIKLDIDWKNPPNELKDVINMV